MIFADPMEITNVKCVIIDLPSSPFSIHDDVIICAYVSTPFDKLRVAGHGEPFGSPFVLSVSKDERLSQDMPVEP